MSEMVDEALRAWLVKSHDYDGTVCLFEELRPDELAQGRDCMRAALAALREPTENIEYICGHGNEDYTGREVWQMAIDEALR